MMYPDIRVERTKYEYKEMDLQLLHFIGVRDNSSIVPKRTGQMHDWSNPLGLKPSNREMIQS